MTAEQLYRNSVQSRLANKSWDEFCGSAISCCGTRESNLGPFPYGPYVELGSNLNGPSLGETNPGVQYVPTMGSILALNFCRSHPTYGGIVRAWLARELQPTTASNCRKQLEHHLAWQRYGAGHDGDELRRHCEQARHLLDLPWPPR